MQRVTVLLFCTFASVMSCRLIATKEECLDTCGCAYCEISGCFMDNDDKPLCFSGWEFAPYTLECARTIAIILFWFGMCFMVIGIVAIIYWCRYRYEIKKLDALSETVIGNV